MTLDIKELLENSNRLLMEDYKRHVERKEEHRRTTGVVIKDQFRPKYSKPILDDIDLILAWHYGFTDEELDFIINYDIKYRMGKQQGMDDDE